MKMSVWIPALVTMSATTLLVHFSVVAFLATNWPAMGEIALVSFSCFGLLLCGAYYPAVGTIMFILCVHNKMLCT